MFKKKQRISSGLFSRILRSGETKHTDHFSVRVVHSKEPRMAVVVSKKVTKTAVKRNTLKRKMRAILKTLSAPWTVVLYAKKGADTLSVTQMQRELIHLLNH